MPEKNTISPVADILKSAERIGMYTSGQTYEQFILDPKTVDAVARNFQVIGEASNRLSAKFKSKHHTIDWKRIRALRNRIVHHYAGIDKAIWNAKETFLPRLLQILRQLG